MADYYPVIAKAVSGLDKSTGEARRALYDRARTALVAQARGVEPALSEPDITRERLALEEAIRKVEAEAARRTRSANGFRDTVAEAQRLGSLPTEGTKDVRADLTAKDGELNRLEPRADNGAGVPRQRWFVLLNGKRHGPFTFAALTQAAKKGVITAETNIWRRGWQKWHPARQVPGLLNEAPLAPDDAEWTALDTLPPRGQQEAKQGREEEKWPQRDRAADELQELARQLGMTNRSVPPSEERKVKQHEEKARLEREEKARLEREEKARLEREEKARLEREEKARLEREEKARLEREEKARLEREEKARLEREEK